MTLEVDILALAPNAISPASLDGRIEAEQVRKVAVVHIAGALGPSAYARIRQAARAAKSDKSVQAVAFVIDCPGGAVKGLMAATAEIRALAKAKPTAALVSGSATSAAYAIAAAAGEVILTEPNALVGSIGVMAVHLDQSGALDKAGIRVSEIFAGAEKSAGSPLRPLDDAGRRAIQGGVDHAYAVLVEDIGKSRPALGEAGARATEARVYHGHNAIKARLADAEGDALELISRMAGRRRENA